MIDFLYQIDVALFYLFNHTLSNPLFDKFFPFITEVKHWYLVYVIMFFLLLIKGGKLGRISAIGAILLIVLTDQFSSFFLKNLVERIRPCNELPDVNILAGCTGSFSFPSSHAVNNFAVAVFFTILFPKYKWALFTIATLLALSRVYCGVHYPSDIIGGAIIGSLFGYILAKVALIINNLIKTKS
ncbi:MAG: phosphatase PAP2 family protein [Melioribacteraceae bacterium]|nr:phosphatase PAP2 family protein [Melioribacteraceae bacterium]